MSIPGVFAVSIFDDSDADPANWIVVQKNRIASVGEFYTNGLVDGEDAIGLEVYAGDDSKLEFECFDDAGDDQLKQWESEDKEVKLVLAGLQTNVLWYEPATIKVTKPRGFGAGARNRTRIRIMKKGGASHKIWSGINILDGAVKLQGFSEGWQDSDASGLADGFIQTSIENCTFLNAIQTLDNTVGDGYFRIDVILPISGLKINLSAFYSLGLGTPKLDIQSRTADDIVEQLLSVAIGAGLISNSLKTNPTHWKFRLLIAQSPDPFTITIQDPALRTDNSSKYLNY